MIGRGTLQAVQYGHAFKLRRDKVAAISRGRRDQISVRRSTPDQRFVLDIEGWSLR